MMSIGASAELGRPCGTEAQLLQIFLQGRESAIASGTSYPRSLAFVSGFCFWDEQRAWLIARIDSETILR